MYRTRRPSVPLQLHGLVEPVCRLLRRRAWRLRAGFFPLVRRRREMHGEMKLTITLTDANRSFGSVLEELDDTFVHEYGCPPIAKIVESHNEIELRTQDSEESVRSFYLEAPPGVSSIHDVGEQNPHYR